MMDFVVRARTKIGIITGSGPDAGLDLWQKVLRANKQMIGDHYRGDLDAPFVSIISEPVLGLSMELEKNDAQVWSALSDVAKELDRQVDYYAIACNTLNYYQSQLGALSLRAQLVSFSEVVKQKLLADGIQKVALLGADSVTDLGEWSPYRQLTEVAEVEIPKSDGGLHQLIYDVKTFGGERKDIIDRFSTLVEGLEADMVLLACTELPLIPIKSKKSLIDVTDLVANELAKLSLSSSR
ncbi:aspartate/glutamate racemase family protein [Marinomonas pollencensis]|uniref:Aspartate racemase n=1 Tax=Marinomonas pollencensis TaxID=491954 RepID=A0A3E0D9V6_9GAMM|nr:aspartate/glutamate racemase family protein [Marinomonas pollencensis]REG79354.1 aspartate racemase [Marinomonas pollencensis]